MTRKGNWFQTMSGAQYWPLDPDPEDVRLDDIAHGLAYQCRFNGHVRDFYSIAQHSVLVSEIVPPEHAMWGLMHDAAEAYIGDMIRPLKLHMPQYREIEALNMRAICERFGLDAVEPPEVKAADNVLLMTERRDLLAKPPKPWTERAEPAKWRIVPWPPRYARDQFLARFRACT